MQKKFIKQYITLKFYDKYSIQIMLQKLFQKKKPNFLLRPIKKKMEKRLKKMEIMGLKQNLRN